MWQGGFAIYQGIINLFKNFLGIKNDYRITNDYLPDLNKTL